MMQTQTPEVRREHQTKFRRGLEQFNAGHFFDAHETWEEIWLASSEPEKTFLQGMIQITAAFHHYQRGNLQGTLSLLEAGLRRLASYPEIYNGIALEALRKACREWTAALAAKQELRANPPPLIGVFAK